MASHIEEMISEEQIDKRVREIAKQISEDYKGKSVRLICILKGSVFLYMRISKENINTGNS